MNRVSANALGDTT